MNLNVMNFVLALISLAVGVTSLVYSKSVLRLFAEFMAKRMIEQYGDLAIKMKWDDPRTWQSFGYRLGMIGVGLAFIAMAFVLVFGTVQL